VTDEETMQQLRKAFASPQLYLCAGPGDAEEPGTGSSCTIAQINLVTQGRLHDGANPDICDIVRGWVIALQDLMPVRVRNSAEWRQTAPGIASSAGAEVRREVVREQRAALLTEWMRTSIRQLPGPAGGPLAVAWRSYCDAPSLATAKDLRSATRQWPDGMPLRTRAVADSIVNAERGPARDDLAEYRFGHSAGRAISFAWTAPLGYLLGGQRLSGHEAEQRYVRAVDPVGILRALLAVT
jgi:hypothetical protein